MYIFAAAAILSRRDGTGDGMPGTGTALDSGLQRSVRNPDRGLAESFLNAARNGNWRAADALIA
jgi:hypothetical protein